MARKRPHLIAILDSHIHDAFSRKRDVGSDEAWWDDVHAAALQGEFWSYLGSLRADVEGAEHLSTLRVLDVLAWMHVREQRAR